MPEKSMTISVKVSDMILFAGTTNLLVANNLGSDLGVTIFDPIAKVGALFHAMLPESRVHPDMAQKNPFIFVDTGLPRMLDAAFAKGAFIGHLIAQVAGGANLMEKGPQMFAVGMQNANKTFEILKKNNIPVRRQAVGGKQVRSLYLNLQTGEGWIDLGETGAGSC
ncbi:MAG: chemotaxis protein CheD [Candidatus Firestonebacteria bacterium]|nr:chemotaxis protein CheD [Candidatus Firestonebacteria bacterium]